MVWRVAEQRVARKADSMAAVTVQSLAEQMAEQRGVQMAVL
jgi:hypothetical protein